MSVRANRALTPNLASQGFRAFKSNVQAAREDREKLAKAAGKFKNQRMGLAFETWKQHTQYKLLLQSRLKQAVGALLNHSLRAGFSGWREAAAIKREHAKKVCAQAHAASMYIKKHCFPNMSHTTIYIRLDIT